jgi:hypothetical protein
MALPDLDPHPKISGATCAKDATSHIFCIDTLERVYSKPPEDWVTGREGNGPFRRCFTGRWNI